VTPKKSTINASFFDSTLILSQPIPLTLHPAEVYLASLGAGSRRTMRSALNAISSILTNGQADASTLNWANLRYQHTAAVRAVLMSKYSPAMANKMLSALRRTLQEAFRLGLMTNEEYARAADVQSIKGTSLLRGRALSKEEIAALMKVCREDTSNAGKRDMALLILLMVGLRRAEVVNLNREDVDPEARLLIIRGAKGQKDRNNYLPVGGVKAICDWLEVRGDEPGPLLHPLGGSKRVLKRRLSEQTVMEAIQRRGSQAGIAYFSPHDFRRTFITDLLEAGVDTITVSGLAGHSSPITTAKYDRRGEKAKKQAIDLLDVHFNDD